MSYMQILHVRHVATKLSLSVIYVHKFDQSCGLTFDAGKRKNNSKYLDEIFMGENDRKYEMGKANLFE